MFNLNTLLVKLRGLIGFEDSYNNDNTIIDADLKTSRSGVLIGPGMHPLLAYENINAVLEQFATVNVTPWSGSTAYKTGAVVSYSGQIWRALTDHQNELPLEGATDWAETNLLSVYLRRLYDNAVRRLFNTLFTNKKLNEASKTLLANTVLYEGQGNLTRRIQKVPGRFVGLRITLKHPDTMALLSKIGLQIDAIQADVKIYLFHSSNEAPLAVFTLNHTKSVTFQWHTITETILSFMSDEINAGGKYYLGYFEDELDGQAIARDMSWTGGSCGTCSQDVHNRGLYSKWSRFIDIQPFYVAGFTGTLWDEETELYVDNTNFGINVRLAAQCDVTDWLAAHQNQFADALGKQITVDLFNEMAFSMRDNQKKQKLAAMAAVALDNTENGQMGAVGELKKAIAALDFDFSDLSPVCNPCNDGQYAVKRTNAWAR